MPETKGERALLVGVAAVRGATAGEAHSIEDSLSELEALARSAGAEVCGRLVQTRQYLDAATLIGSGKVQEVAGLAEAEEIDVVIFDRDLSPTQLRNVEKAIERKVLDRTQLILDIFASRARTREGRLQVELAQLNYMLPRLSELVEAMSKLGGGIGTRGPGETQLETDRRRVNRRIKKIREQLSSVRRTRSIQRRQRQGIPLATVAMVGYTNAGKSTLFNRMTGAEVTADQRMFATLDPTARSLALPSKRRVVLSDTVGFIRRLPTTLVQAFRATLEEVTEAALLIHVVDTTSPEAEEHGVHVIEVLQEIGASAIPQIVVLNKVDRLDSRPEGDAFLHRMMGHLPNAAAESGAAVRALCVSAKTGEGVPDLLTAIDTALPVDPVAHVVFRLPLGAGAELHLLHQFARVLNVRYEEDECVVEAEAAESLRRQLVSYIETG